VSLARRLAKRGFTVLRLDLAGIGDSPAGDGVENVTYPRSGYEDLKTALDWLGADKAIVAGLCSGGDYAFQMGVRDDRVVGSVILNPRTFCVVELASVETGNIESVVAAADHARGGAPVPESLRAMTERGVDTLLVVTEKDPGIHWVDTHWGAEMGALTGNPNFVRHDIAGTDHNFTSLWSQEVVADIVENHLANRYLK
jgi:dienelactone hydrolase